MRGRYFQPGISMAETVVATLLVGLVLVSIIQIVGPIVRSRSVQTHRLVATNLANELVEEISTKAFTSPILDDLESMGPGVGENRSTYDDVDDYNGWSASPPQLSSGSSNLFLAGWTRSAKVVHVDVNDPRIESGSYTGLKRITVTVSKNGQQLAQVIALRSYAADLIGFSVHGD